MRRKPQFQYERILHEKNKNSRGGVRNLLVLTLAIVIALSSVCMVSAKDTITITKKWDDGLTGVDAANRDAPKVVVTATMSRSEMLDLFYPVGTCYVTVDNSFNPNEAWGGTWVKLSEGQNVIQAGSTFKFGTTGGNKDAIVVSHSHTVNSHTHSIPSLSGSTNSAGAHSHPLKVSKVGAAGTVKYLPDSNSSTTLHPIPSAGDHTHTVTTNASTTGASSPNTNTVGSSGTNANMQPYVAGNIWKRTA